MFDLFYQHSDFVVVNKHANVSVHKDEQDTAFVGYVEQSLNIEKLYLVHRLDKMTSGLLILAKNSPAASYLSSLFANREIEKYYVAIGNKKPKKKQGLVKGDMERSRRASWKLCSSQNNPAVTQFFSAPAGSGHRLFLCKPKTGKTHQIRVALKSIGSPILGDPIYSHANEADRGYLHAYALRFHYQQESIAIVCPPDSNTSGEYWQTAETSQQLIEWQQPWNLNWPKL